jgi:hypothetical protein
MGVWTEVKGSVYIDSKCGCSLESLVKELYDECTISVRILSNNHSVRTIDWRFEEGGSRADTIICNFMEKVLQYDKRARFDITASIRYIT